MAKTLKQVSGGRKIGGGRGRRKREKGEMGGRKGRRERKGGKREGKKGEGDFIKDV